MRVRASESGSRAASYPTIKKQSPCWGAAHCCCSCIRPSLLLHTWQPSHLSTATVGTAPVHCTSTPAQLTSSQVATTAAQGGADHRMRTWLLELGCSLAVNCLAQKCWLLMHASGDLASRWPRVRSEGRACAARRSARACTRGPAAGGLPWSKSRPVRVHLSIVIALTLPRTCTLSHSQSTDARTHAQSAAEKDFRQGAQRQTSAAALSRCPSPA